MDFSFSFKKTSCLEIILKLQKICNNKNIKIVQNNCTPFTLKIPQGACIKTRDMLLH